MSPKLIYLDSGTEDMFELNQKQHSRKRSLPWLWSMEVSYLGTWPALNIEATMMFLAWGFLGNLWKAKAQLDSCDMTMTQKCQ